MINNQGGHSVGGSATLERRITTQLQLKLEYDRIHESYAGVPSLASNPDSNSGTASLIWEFRRPLGR